MLAAYVQSQTYRKVGTENYGSSPLFYLGKTAELHIQGE